jgi:hypothetical protein
LPFVPLHVLGQSPFDRSIALACTMRTLRGRWLHVQCRCGQSSPNPVRLMLREEPSSL